MGPSKLLFRNSNSFRLAGNIGPWSERWDMVLCGSSPRSHDDSSLAFSSCFEHTFLNNRVLGGEEMEAVALREEQVEGTSSLK